MGEAEYQRDHPSLFQEGSYLPLTGGEGLKEYVCAFAKAEGRGSGLGGGAEIFDPIGKKSRGNAPR